MRAAMVRDWREAYERGEDAVMIAKRNRDVERLNAIAREVRRDAGGRSPVRARLANSGGDWSTWLPTAWGESEIVAVYRMPARIRGYLVTRSVFGA